MELGKVRKAALRKMLEGGLMLLALAGVGLFIVGFGLLADYLWMSSWLGKSIVIGFCVGFAVTMFYAVCVIAATLEGLGENSSEGG